MTVSVPAPLRARRRLTPAIRFGRRSAFLLFLTTVFGVAAFGWPLLIHQASGQNTAHSGDAPWIFVGLLPLLLAIVMAELSEGAIDAKAVALLGILAACFAALRVASPGINGFEPEWFLLILSARVFGRGFGFVLGAVAFFASALITGGVGPWLPFQMLAAGWVGFGAGCLPALRGFPERLLLAGYGAVSALLYGLVINFWFWPFVGSATSYSFVPGLGTVLVGDDPGSRAYVNGKHRDCAQVGIASIRRDLPADATQAQVEAVVDELGGACLLLDDDDVEGGLDDPHPASDSAVNPARATAAHRDT